MNNVLEQSFRWYGPEDTVSLKAICQVGATGVITSLHDIAYGDIWPLEAILERRALLETAGLRWTAVESLPVHESIKTRTGDYRQHIENYKTSLMHLGQAGVDVVIYNFMPVLDWVRTDLQHRLPDGTECLYFDPVHFAAFEIFLLGRKGAEADYSNEQIAAAEEFFNSLTDEQKIIFERSLIDVFPGTKLGLTIDDIRAMLKAYEAIDEQQLKEHLKLFIQEVIPTAAQAGVRMAIHPDDPPWSILGLPRIVSSEEQLAEVLQMVEHEANGLCFCTGSLSPRAENDLPAMIRRFGSRIQVLHLRSTQRNADGSFYEADHLSGSVDMFEVMTAVLEETAKRKRAGKEHWRLAYRPDHGHTMLDDLDKPPVANPGYSMLGRMKGLAELRGLEAGILRSRAELTERLRD